MDKTILFFIGKSDILKELINEDIHNNYTYVHSGLVIYDNYIENGPFSVKNTIRDTFNNEIYLNENATFIFVLDKPPQYSYKSLREAGYKIQTLILEDK